MKDIDLQLLLRYVLAGGFFISILVLAFIPYLQLLNFANNQKDAVGIFVAGAGFFATLIGSILYSLYRAIIFPPILIIAQVLAGRIKVNEILKQFFLGRKGKGAGLDIARWRRMKDKESPQEYLKEWGSQIHFLGCSGLAGLSALTLGHLLGLVAQTATYDPLLYLSWLLLIASFISSVRYQFREIEIEKL